MSYKCINKIKIRQCSSHSIIRLWATFRNMLKMTINYSFLCRCNCLLYARWQPDPDIISLYSGAFGIHAQKAGFPAHYTKTSLVNNLLKHTERWIFILSNIIIVWFLFCALDGCLICFLSLVKHSVIAYWHLSLVKLVVVIARPNTFIIIIYLFDRFTEN